MSESTVATPFLVAPGEGTRYRVLGDRIEKRGASDRRASRSWEIFEIESQPGAGPPLHSHDWEEGYYLLEGELSFVIDGDAFTAKANDFVCVPSDTPHSLTNSGGSPCRYLLWVAPGAVEPFFAELHNRSLSGILTLEEVAATAERHGIHLR